MDGIIVIESLHVAHNNGDIILAYKGEVISSGKIVNAYSKSALGKIHDPTPRVLVVKNIIHMADPDL